MLIKLNGNRMVNMNHIIAVENDCVSQAGKESFAIIWLDGMKDPIHINRNEFVMIEAINGNIMKAALEPKVVIRDKTPEQQDLPEKEDGNKVRTTDNPNPDVPTDQKEEVAGGGEDEASRRGLTGKPPGKEGKNTKKAN